MLVETLQNDYELVLASKWECIKEKIIGPWTVGRNYQLIEIRGVPNRWHKPPSRLIELRLFLQLDDGGKKFAEVVRVELQALFADMCMNGHRRVAVCSRDSSSKGDFKEKLGEKQAMVMYTM